MQPIFNVVTQIIIHHNIPLFCSKKKLKQKEFDRSIEYNITMILRSKYDTKTPWVNKSCKWCFREGTMCIKHKIIKEQFYNEFCNTIIQFLCDNKKYKAYIVSGTNTLYYYTGRYQIEHSQLCYMIRNIITTVINS